MAALVLLPWAVLAGTPVTYTELEVPNFWSLRTGGLRDLAGLDLNDIREVSHVFGMSPNAHGGVWGDDACRGVGLCA